MAPVTSIIGGGTGAGAPQFGNDHDLTGLRLRLVVRQIRAEKSESCAILHRSMKLCMVVDSDSKINLEVEPLPNLFIFGRSGYLKN